MTDHERYVEFAGAYVLGALEPDDRRNFEDHLPDCEQCRSDVSSLAVIPGLLNRVRGLREESMPDTLVDDVAASARNEWLAISRSRRWWRAAAVAAVAVIVAIAASTFRSSDPQPDIRMALGAGPVTGEVSVESRIWGSALSLELDGLPRRDVYVAWVVGTDGTRQQAATWGPTPTGRARLTGASAVATLDIQSILITAGDGTEILATTLPLSG